MVSNWQLDCLQATSLPTGLPAVIRTSSVSLEIYCSLEAELSNSLHHVFTAILKRFGIMQNRQKLHEIMRS